MGFGHALLPACLRMRRPRLPALQRQRVWPAWLRTGAARMSPTALSFTVNVSAEDSIRSHLLHCEKNFKPPLSQRVDIAAYSRKIREKALTIEAWDGDVLVGLVAGYLNAADQSSFIT